MVPPTSKIGDIGALNHPTLLWVLLALPVKLWRGVLRVPTGLLDLSILMVVWQAKVSKDAKN